MYFNEPKADWPKLKNGSKNVIRKFYPASFRLHVASFAASSSDTSLNNNHQVELTQRPAWLSEVGSDLAADDLAKLWVHQVHLQSVVQFKYVDQRYYDDERA